MSIVKRMLEGAIKWFSVWGLSTLNCIFNKLNSLLLVPWAVHQGILTLDLLALLGLGKNCGFFTWALRFQNCLSYKITLLPKGHSEGAFFASYRAKRMWCFDHSCIYYTQFVKGSVIAYLQTCKLRKCRSLQFCNNQTINKISNCCFGLIVWQFSAIFSEFYGPFWVRTLV
jgi:hypothetical protein